MIILLTYPVLSNFFVAYPMTVIQENAIFIADAHYLTHGDALLALLYRINAGEISVPQLFLMGDIFDLLVGGLEKSYVPNEEAITLIDAIGSHTEVFYFEGNHDFQLGKIFKNITIFPREKQPQYMGCNGFIVGLSHGDRFATGWKHDLMSRLLRTPLVISLIKLFKPHIVAEKTAHLKTKEICHQIPHFDQKAKRIFDSYKGAFWVIEGHYHQACTHYHYISLPSLACQKQVGVIRDGAIIFVDIAEI